MDDPGQGQAAVMGTVQASYIPMPYQANQMLGTTMPISAPGQLTPASQAQLTQHQISYQQIQQQQRHQLNQTLQAFWASQYQEIMTTPDFKNHSLPLARIKKIMKADEDVRMIAAEAPVLFARACEMFILELTYRSWAQAEESKRRTLQKNDIAAAITKTEVFDFLVDIVPREEVKEDTVLSIPKEDTSDSLAYYYVPHVGSLGMVMGKPEVNQSMLYAQQPQPYFSSQMMNQEQQQQPKESS
ncbi:nuclear transcription factor Y subunit C-3-like [Typha latifolia]|uniref:nuclear transcription factor Y subunit C-3-like n=1 Tax=Typha latifolia TaxID=4733 RepID=UPI003C2AF0FF